MRKLYQRVTMEVIELCIADIVTMSLNDNDDVAKDIYPPKK